MINSGFIGYLAVRPFSEDEENDSKNGFDRSDDGYENPSQETYDKIGIQNVDPNLLLEVHDLSRFSTIVNYVDGQYLWVMSKKPIKNIIDGSMNNIPLLLFSIMLKQDIIIMQVLIRYLKILCLEEFL